MARANAGARRASTDHLGVPRFLELAQPRLADSPSCNVVEHQRQGLGELLSTRDQEAAQPTKLLCYEAGKPPTGSFKGVSRYGLNAVWVGVRQCRPENGAVCCADALRDALQEV